MTSMVLSARVDAYALASRFAAVEMCAFTLRLFLVTEADNSRQTAALS